MENTSSPNEVNPAPGERRRGEPWALGTVLGYASASIFDRLGVQSVDPLVGPVLRGLPSLLMGIILVWRNKTFGQMRPGSSRYIGGRAIMAFVGAGIISTLGLFLYYFAIRLGGVIITIPAVETYVIWGTFIAWFFLHERIHRHAQRRITSDLWLVLGEQAGGGICWRDEHHREFEGVLGQLLCPFPPGLLPSLGL